MLLRWFIIEFNPNVLPSCWMSKLHEVTTFTPNWIPKKHMDITAVSLMQYLCHGNICHIHPWSPKPPGVPWGNRMSYNIYICITHIYIYVCTYIHHCLVVSPHPSLITNNYTAFLHRATWKTCRSSNIQAAAVTALGSTVRECWQSCIEFNAKQGG
jgi:hypothetical protein